MRNIFIPILILMYLGKYEHTNYCNLFLGENICSPFRLNAVDSRINDYDIKEISQRFVIV